MDRKLLELLVCPATRQPLVPLEAGLLGALNAAIGENRVTRSDGTLQVEPLAEALASADRSRVYRVDDGIPVLLADEAIPTETIPGFTAR